MNPLLSVCNSESPQVMVPEYTLLYAHSPFSWLPPGKLLFRTGLSSVRKKIKSTVKLNFKLYTRSNFRKHEFKSVRIRWKLIFPGSKMNAVEGAICTILRSNLGQGNLRNSESGGWVPKIIACLSICNKICRLLWRAAAPGLKPLRLPHAQNEAFSCPRIFSKTLRFCYVASSLGSPPPPSSWRTKKHCLIDAAFITSSEIV